jgi:hypothetical protein
VTFHAKVTSDQVGTETPGGFVQFRVDGLAVGSAVALDDDGGATSQPVTDLAPGTRTVTAVYSGDPHFTGQTRSIDQHVDAIGTTTALTASTTSPTYGDPVTLTATVTPASTALGAPSGSVAFVDGSTTLATVPLTTVGSTGRATYSTSALGGGAHAIRAVYSGPGSFASSTSPTVTVNVARKATALSVEAALVNLNPLLGINLGQLRATLTSGGRPMAGQPVVFTIGAATACTATTDGNGLAICNASSKIVQLTLAGGYKATYAGNANYQGSTASGGLIK